MKINVSKKDVIYIDMDGVLVQSNETKEEWYQNRLIAGFFLKKIPQNLAVDSFKFLVSKCEVYILSTPVWNNPQCWIEKRLWVQKYLGETARKKLILTHNKSLNKGLVLIDDNLQHGAESFDGHLIHFGSKDYPSWKEVLDRLQFITP